MEASKKEINKITFNELGILESTIAPKVQIEKLYFPENENKVEIIEGNNNKEKAFNLLSKLKEEGVI